MKDECDDVGSINRADLNREIDALRREMDQRHKNHELNFDAQEKLRLQAVSSMKDLMASEKEARNKAIEKADAALVEYKLASNNIMHRPEIEGKIETLREDIASLRETRSGGAARTSLVQEWLPAIAIIVGVMSILASAALAVLLR